MYHKTENRHKLNSQIEYIKYRNRLNNAMDKIKWVGDYHYPWV